MAKPKSYRGSIDSVAERVAEDARRHVAAMLAQLMKAGEHGEVTITARTFGAERADASFGYSQRRQVEIQG